MTKDDYVKEHFPEIECGSSPTGNQILVQLRTVRETTQGGIVLALDTRDFNNGNTQVARLIKVGQIAYRDRGTGERWKEGAWAQIGDVVIVPKFGGFRFELDIPGSGEKAIFALFNDYDVKLVIYDNFESYDKLL